MRKVIRWIRKTKGGENKQKGLTLVEILVAMTILTTTLVGVEMSVAAGLAQLKDQQVGRMAAECSRIIMEYFSTIPADTIYQEDASKGSPVVGTFMAGGYPGLNAFVIGANSACKTLTQSGRVSMAYSVCPSCVANTQVDPTTLVESTTCYYELDVNVSFNGLAFSNAPHKPFNLRKKFFVAGSDCETICGKGDVTKPDSVFSCVH